MNEEELNELYELVRRFATTLKTGEKFPAWSMMDAIEKAKENLPQ